MGKTIAVCNQKGGVGKTTTTLNLGVGLVRQGKRVLLVSWNGGAPKLDVREWSPDHSRMSRGITLTEQQGIRFAQLLIQR